MTILGQSSDAKIAAAYARGFNYIGVGTGAREATCSTKGAIVQNNQQQYRPGDVANGYVLTDTGQWLPVGGPPPAAAAPKAKKPIYKRWWAIALAAVFVLSGISSAMGGESDTDKASADSKPPASTPAKTEDRTANLADESEDSSSKPTEEPKVETEPKATTEPEPTAKAEPKPKAPAVTVSMENAADSGAGYLDMAAFSRSGLIEQLEFEGYSTKDATYGVDSLHADWRAEAVESAKGYLDMTSFSRSGLIEQLVFEGFSPENAAYGVSKTGL